MRDLLRRLFRRTEQEVKPKLIKPIRREDTWVRPNSGFCDLDVDTAAFIQNKCKCPYCNSALYEGPRGGMSINLFCGNEKCNSRFNVAELPIPWGQFTGECPPDFYEGLKRKKGKMQ